ncbi:MAG: hypothetical protein ABSG57_07755 [Candidatus Bathyarchaeia archaeon]
MSNSHKAKSGQVVGFYRDRDGTTKPITKSAAQLNRKKVVENAHDFKSVGVVGRVRDSSQVLEDLIAKFHSAEDRLAALKEQQTELQAKGKQSPQIDAEIQKEDAQIKLLKNKIHGLHA